MRGRAVVPRGIRNNNPGNVRPGARWKGMAGADADGYVIFLSPLWGLRAMARVLMTYQHKHGIHTIQKMIERWAPAGDNNNVQAYVQHVCKQTGLRSEQVIDIIEHLPWILPAMIKHECGQQPYSPRLIAQAIQLAKE